MKFGGYRDCWGDFRVGLVDAYTWGPIPFQKGMSFVFVISVHVLGG
jgi:hypothetical protein